VIVTFGRHDEHPRIATHRTLERLLRPVTLDGEPVERLVDELHVGHRLVVAEMSPPGPSDSGGPRVTRAA
jgi:hypothetical protein